MIPNIETATNISATPRGFNQESNTSEPNFNGKVAAILGPQQGSAAKITQKVGNPSNLYYRQREEPEEYPLNSKEKEKIHGDAKPTDRANLVKIIERKEDSNPKIEEQSTSLASHRHIRKQKSQLVLINADKLDHVDKNDATIGIALGTKPNYLSPKIFDSQRPRSISANAFEITPQAKNPPKDITEEKIHKLKKPLPPLPPLKYAPSLSSLKVSTSSTSVANKPQEQSNFYSQEAKQGGVYQGYRRINKNSNQNGLKDPNKPPVSSSNMEKSALSIEGAIQKQTICSLKTSQPSATAATPPEEKEKLGEQAKGHEDPLNGRSVKKMSGQDKQPIIIRKNITQLSPRTLLIEDSDPSSKKISGSSSSTTKSSGSSSISTDSTSKYIEKKSLAQVQNVKSHLAEKELNQNMQGHISRTKDVFEESDIDEEINEEEVQANLAVPNSSLLFKRVKKHTHIYSDMGNAAKKSSSAETSKTRTNSFRNLTLKYNTNASDSTTYKKNKLAEKTEDQFPKNLRSQNQELVSIPRDESTAINQIDSTRSKSSTTDQSSGSYNSSSSRNTVSPDSTPRNKSGELIEFSSGISFNDEELQTIRDNITQIEEKIKKIESTREKQVTMSNNNLLRIQILSSTYVELMNISHSLRENSHSEIISITKRISDLFKKIDELGIYYSEKYFIKFLITLDAKVNSNQYSLGLFGAISDLLSTSPRALFWTLHSDHLFITKLQKLFETSLTNGLNIIINNSDGTQDIQKIAFLLIEGRAIWKILSNGDSNTEKKLDWSFHERKIFKSLEKYWEGKKHKDLIEIITVQTLLDKIDSGKGNKEELAYSLAKTIFNLRIQSFSDLEDLPSDEMSLANILSEAQYKELFKKTMTLSEHLSRFVTNNIVARLDMSKRVRLIEVFCKCIQICLNLGDIEDGAAIYRGLVHCSVDRLQETFDSLKSKVKVNLQKISDLLSVTKNFAVYRNYAKKHPPLVPYLPVLGHDRDYAVNGNKGEALEKWKKVFQKEFLKIAHHYKLHRLYQKTTGDNIFYIQDLRIHFQERRYLIAQDSDALLIRSQLLEKKKK